VTQTITPTVTETVTQTITPSVTETITQTTTKTVTCTVTQTVTQTITQTATPTVTQTATPTDTATDTPTPAALSYILPSTAVSGDTVVYSYRIIANGTGPITQVDIAIPNGVILSGTPISQNSGTVTATGSDIKITYASGWNSLSDPYYDVITFGAISSSGDKYYGCDLNLIADAQGVTPNGFSQIVAISTPTSTVTRTVTPTFTVTQTVTPTVTPTFTVTDTVTKTVTATVTQTATQTITQTVTPTDTQTVTQTETKTVTQTVTSTVTMTATPTFTITGTDTQTVTPTDTRTDTPTFTATSTDTQTVTPTGTPTFTVTHTVTPTVTQTGTPTMTATQTITPTYTPTFTETFTSTVTPTNTPRIGLVVIAPGQSYIASDPGYTWTPVVEEAGQAVTITVRSVEENTWTTYASSDLISLASSQAQWTILDSSKNLSSGEAQFYVRFLKAGLFYTVTVTDAGGTYGSADSSPIPVTVTGFGNAAIMSYTAPRINSVVKGMKNLYVMEVNMTNPNSGGAVFEMTGITLTAGSAQNKFVENVTAVDGAGNTLSVTQWGTAKQVFIPAVITANPMQTSTVSLYFDINGGAPDGSFYAEIAGGGDIMMGKLDGTTVYADPASQGFPYKTSDINTTGSNFSDSFFNYPNPFKAGSALTTIQYYLPSDAGVSLKIYDLLGRKVKTMFESKQQSGGVLYSTAWDGKNDSGSVVLNGVYYGILKVGGSQYETKIVVVK
jgi:hypothetical protein